MSTVDVWKAIGVAFVVILVAGLVFTALIGGAAICSAKC